jgi:acetyltransferase-like isoleucine patch superfamily enzyme
MKAFFKRVWRIYDFWKRGVVVWKYCNISLDAKIGDNVSIGAYTEIGPNVIIGDNTRIGAMCFIPDKVVIGRNAFIGPRVTFSNDMYPPSPPEQWQGTFISDYASVGAGVCIRPGVNVGTGALIGIGSVLTHNIPARERWVGPPAREIKKKEVDYATT